MLLYQILACTTHREYKKKSYKNNKFQIASPRWNELPDGLYSASDT